MILQMNNSFSISRYVDKSNYKFNYSTLSSYDKTILNYLYMPSNESNIETLEFTRQMIELRQNEIEPQIRVIGFQIPNK